MIGGELKMIKKSKLKGIVATILVAVIFTVFWTATKAITTQDVVVLDGTSYTVDENPLL